MRNRILGAFAVVVGGIVLLRDWSAGVHLDFSSAYASGASTGLIFMAVFFLAGWYYLLKGSGS